MRTFLAEFFDCREDDLRIFNEVDPSVIDVSEIADQMLHGRQHTLNDFICLLCNEVAWKLQRELNERRDEIEQELLENIEDEQRIGREEGCTEEQIKEQETLDVKYFHRDLELLRSDELQPVQKRWFCVNGVASYVCIQHLSFYQRNMPDVVSELEHAIPFQIFEY